jgi:CheY-like chemotaxis protein
VASLLLIEDTPVVLNLLRRGLGEAGYEVDTASDASTGLERCLRGRYDLVVTDFSLDCVCHGGPGRSTVGLCEAQAPRGDHGLTAVGGIWLLQQLHKHRTAIPLVVITGRDRAEVLHAIETAGRVGVVTVLQKPFSLAELTRVVRDALASAPQTDRSGARA